MSQASSVQPRALQPFHLAFPVTSLENARAFYGDLLGCPEGRSSPEWVDFDFFGHQLVAHLAPNEAGRAGVNAVDGDDVPVRHFGVVLTMDDMARARDGRLFHQGADEHYDQISALIKSVRGSDPDAGLYWMARMIEAGEDPRFLARRMVILASEDIGLADPQALLVAEAAARAVEYVGLPEAALNLAEAVIYLARAPKSNAVVVALGRAQADVRASVSQEVPTHLRDAHYKGAATLGHGDGYVYPHDDPSGVVPQQYRPDSLEGRVYYEPTPRDREADS